MKKHIFAALTALALAPFVSIKAETSYSLLVNTADGNTVEYDFEYLPVATFEGDVMIITDDRSIEGTRFAMDNVVNMTIKTVDTGVASIEGDNHIKVSLVNDIISVSGLEAGAKLMVYDAAGKTLVSATAAQDGTASISIGNLGKGVFVASMPNYSFKFIR